jgi:hypothetical protein
MVNLQGYQNESSSQQMALLPVTVHVGQFCSGLMVIGTENGFPPSSLHVVNGVFDNTQVLYDWAVY